MTRNEFGKLEFTPLEETRIEELTHQFLDEKLDAKKLIHLYRTLSVRDFHTLIGSIISNAEMSAEHQVEDEYFGGDAA